MTVASDSDAGKTVKNPAEPAALPLLSQRASGSPFFLRDVRS